MKEISLDEKRQIKIKLLKIIRKYGTEILQKEGVDGKKIDRIISGICIHSNLIINQEL